MSSNGFGIYICLQHNCDIVENFWTVFECALNCTQNQSFDDVMYNPLVMKVTLTDACHYAVYFYIFIFILVVSSKLK